MPSQTRADLLAENEELMAIEDQILDVLDDPELDSEAKLEVIEQLLDDEE